MFFITITITITITFTLQTHVMFHGIDFATYYGLRFR